jgi:pseudouridine-5'-monophosphatase
MDGLLLDTEDKYSLVTNEILAKYGKPPMPWSIKAKMQGKEISGRAAVPTTTKYSPMKLYMY